MLVHLLINYEVQRIEERPQAMWLGGVYVPPVKATMKVRPKCA